MFLSRELMEVRKFGNSLPSLINMDSIWKTLYGVGHDDSDIQVACTELTVQSILWNGSEMFKQEVEMFWPGIFCGLFYGF